MDLSGEGIYAGSVALRALIPGDNLEDHDHGLDQRHLVALSVLLVLVRLIEQKR
jgi:hypothetical protein